MNEEGFEGKYVLEKEVVNWFFNVPYGQITREKLERQRQREANNSDMMMNTSILYHPESLSEMQLIGLLTVWTYL
jgi:vacuolar-type H+-ATPase subunit C/Vma6